MIPQLPILDGEYIRTNNTKPQSCNKCGECCRHGGVCVLRGPSWNRISTIPLQFEEVCSLLQKDSTCAVMNMVHKFGNDIYLREVGVVGNCDFPQFRLDSPPPIC